jgi:uncharacterized protein YndB with AHSA1/START domain
MTFHASRTIAAPPASVLAAFADPARLARWWGPAGFTSTFETFAFEPGGHWSFTMHGPDGKHHPNAIVVTEIVPSTRLVLHHVSPPRYLLTVTLEPTADGGTLVGWHQEFESADVGRRMESIVVAANEQVLDRLSAEVSREQIGARAHD